MVNQLIYELKLSTEEANKKLDQLINSQNSKSAKAGKQAGESFGQSFKNSVELFLSAVSFGALINGVKEVSNAFLSQEKAQLGLSSQVENYNKIAKETGKNLIEVDEIQRSINEQYEKFGGIISKGELTKAYKDLIQGGVTSTSQIEETLGGFIDIASTGKSEFLTMGSAVGQLAEQFRSERAALGETAGLSEEYISQILPGGIKLLEKETGLKDLTIEKLTDEQRARAKLLGLQSIFQRNQGNYQKQLDKGVLAQDQFNAKLFETKIALGSALAPAFLEALKSLTPFVEKLTEFVVNNPELVENIVKIALGITGTATAFKGLSLAVNFFTGVFGNMFRMVKLFTTFLIANPWILIITAIITGLVLLVKNWDKVVEVFQKGIEWLGNLFSSWGENIKNTFNKVLDGIKNVWGGIVNWFQTNIIDRISNLFTSLKNTIFNIFDGMKVAIGNSFIWMVNQLVNAINYFIGVYDKVKGGLSKAGIDMPDINKVQSLEYLTTQAEKDAQKAQAQETARNLVSSVQNYFSNNFGRSTTINNYSSGGGTNFDNYGVV